MIYKNLLITQANEIAQLLNEYVISHNKMLQSAGTFKSLFQSVEFLEMYKEIDKVKTNFENKVNELKKIKEEYYGNLTDISVEFFDALENYFNALFDAVKQLHLLIFRLYETSKGFVNNKEKLSWSEYSQLTKVYDEKVKGYVGLGDKLNRAYQALENEPNDSIDDEVEETNTAEVLGTVKLTEIKINPLESQPMLYIALILLLIFITIAVFLNNLLSIIFWMLSVFIGFIIISILYMRLSAKWRRVHFPLMIRYARAMVYVQVQGQYEHLAIDKKIDLALLSLLQSVFPNISSEHLQSHYGDLLDELPKFMDHEMMSMVLERKLPEAPTKDIEKMARHLAEKIKNEKFRKIWLVVSDLIEKKYGKEEKLEYVSAIIKGNAT